MENLASIYSPDFFREWGKGNVPYVETAEAVAAALLAKFRPRRLIDIGCGCGVYGHFFSRRGVEVVSIDGVTPPAETAFPAPIELRDITEPIDNIWGHFDLTLCLEVAEHIPEHLCDPFLENLTRFGGLLVLSAAPPNQGGTFHVNEQPKRYWIERLARHGFSYNRKLTGEIIEPFKLAKPGFMWMCQHISIYERDS